MSDEFIPVRIAVMTVSDTRTNETDTSGGYLATAIQEAGHILADRVIVADDALNYVPFEALVRSTDGQDYASLNYLIKTNEIVYAPSASVIAAIRQQGSKGSGKGVLVVADPVFNSSDPRAKGSSAASSGYPLRSPWHSTRDRYASIPTFSACCSAMGTWDAKQSPFRALTSRLSTRCASGSANDTT